MEGGEDVVEEVLNIRAETVKIALGGTRQIGASLCFDTADSEAVVVEVGGKYVGAAFDQMQRTHMFREARLRFL